MAFVQERENVHAVLKLKQTVRVHDRLVDNTYCTMVSLDVEGAFDSKQWSILKFQNMLTRKKTILVRGIFVLISQVEYGDLLFFRCALKAPLCYKLLSPKKLIKICNNHQHYITSYADDTIIFKCADSRYILEQRVKGTSSCIQ